MTLCRITRGQCVCQPDEGTPCPDESEDYLRAFAEAWQASRAAALEDAAALLDRDADRQEQYWNARLLHGEKGHATPFHAVVPRHYAKAIRALVGSSASDRPSAAKEE